MKHSSSWISSILYKRIGEETYVAVMLKNEPVALLYGGKDTPVPSYLPGLLQASPSVGKAYHKLLKGKYNYQRVEGVDKVRELKEMMK